MLIIDIQLVQAQIVVCSLLIYLNITIEFKWLSLNELRLSAALGRLKRKHMYTAMVKGSHKIQYHPITARQNIRYRVVVVLKKFQFKASNDAFATIRVYFNQFD